MLTGRIDIAEEPLHRCLPEAEALLRSHWDEVCHDKAFLTLNPNYEVYRKLEDAGATALATVRVDDRLVGYLLFILDHHLHYKHIKTAIEDLHYLHPDYRSGSGWAGFRLLKFGVDMVKARGATFITLRTKVRDNHGALFERMGFRATDVVYTMAAG